MPMLRAGFEPWVTELGSFCLHFADGETKAGDYRWPPGITAEAGWGRSRASETVGTVLPVCAWRVSWSALSDPGNPVVS